MATKYTTSSNIYDKSTNYPDTDRGGPDDSSLGDYFTRILIGDYVKTTPFGKSLGSDWKPTHELRLPLPTSLKDTTTLSYSTDNLGAIGDIFNGSGVTNMAEGSLEANGLRSGVGSATKVEEIAAGYLGSSSRNKLTAFLGKQLGSVAENNADTISSAIQQGIGLAPNPNPSVAFKGPDLRHYSFSWAFYPKNEDESRAIHTMINVLKSSALPENNTSQSAAVLKYPKLVQLNFFPWDYNGSGYWYWSSSSIIKFKKSFITAVDVDYSPFGTPAFFKGTRLPVSYTLSLAFQEVEYMMSGDWGGHFAPKSANTPATPTPNLSTIPGNTIVHQNAQSDIAAGRAAFEPSRGG